MFPDVILQVNQTVDVHPVEKHRELLVISVGNLVSSDNPLCSNSKVAVGEETALPSLSQTITDQVYLVEEVRGAPS